MTCISNLNDSNSLYEYIINDIIDINDDSYKTEFYFNKVKVFLNGRWVGITINPIEFYNILL